MTAAARFAWLSGRSEVYPLLAVIGLGLGLTTYSCGRHLWTNPDLHVSKTHRLAGPVDDNGVVLKRAQGYGSSIFKDMKVSAGLRVRQS